MISLPSSPLRRNVLAIWATTVALLAMVVFVDAGAILGKRRNNKSNDKSNESSRGLSVENDSGRKADVFWVNTFVTPEAFVPQFVDDGISSGLPYGADKAVSSYSGHTFEIRELPAKKTNKCVSSVCRSVRYTVTKRRDQRIIVNPDYTVTVKDDIERAYTNADDMFTRCQEKVVAGGHSLVNSIELITTCIEEEIKGKVDYDRKERAFHSKVHRHMATELVPFICANVNETQSVEISNTTWINDDEDQKYLVRNLHKLPTSEIFVVDDFVSKETCDALKIYRHKFNDGDIVGVPQGAAMEKTKQGKLLLDTYYKMYQILMHRFQNWKDLDFKGDFLFEYFKDPIDYKTPSHLCTTQEDVDEVVAAMEAGKLKKCLIPGGVPEAAPTKHIVVEEGTTNEEKNQKRQLAQMFLFCDEPKHQLGGLQFPFAAVHTTPKVGKLVVAVHRHADDKNHGFDGYVNEYHMCPNHDVYVHTVYDHHPPIFEAGEDEGEL